MNFIVNIDCEMKKFFTSINDKIEEVSSWMDETFKANKKSDEKNEEIKMLRKEEVEKEKQFLEKEL